MRALDVGGVGVRRRKRKKGSMDSGGESLAAAGTFVFLLPAVAATRRHSFRCDAYPSELRLSSASCCFSSARLYSNTLVSCAAPDLESRGPGLMAMTRHVYSTRQPALLQRCDSSSTTQRAAPACKLSCRVCSLQTHSKRCKTIFGCCESEFFINYSSVRKRQDVC